MKSWIFIYLLCSVKGSNVHFDENGLACGVPPEDDMDVCKDYDVLDETWRHISNSGGDNCDVAMEGAWYRIYVNGSSAQIPTVCIKNSACGTTIPLRVDLEERPMPEEGCTMEAASCGSYVILGKWDCCVLRQRLLIHNCGTFYVYKLSPPDRCHMGYCSQVSEDDIEHLTVKTGESAEIVTPTMSFEDDSDEEIKNVEERDVGVDNSDLGYTTEAIPVCSRACHLSTSALGCSRACRNGECIADKYWCDGVPDCEDNSDEDTCGSHLQVPCPEGLKRCNDNSCVPQNVECQMTVDDNIHTSTFPTHTYTFPLFTWGTLLTTTAPISDKDIQSSTTIDPSSQQSHGTSKSSQLSQGSSVSTDLDKVLPTSISITISSTLHTIENGTIFSEVSEVQQSKLLDSTTSSVSMETHTIDASIRGSEMNQTLPKPESRHNTEVIDQTSHLTQTSSSFSSRVLESDIEKEPESAESVIHISSVVSDSLVLELTSTMLPESSDSTVQEISPTKTLENIQPSSDTVSHSKYIKNISTSMEILSSLPHASEYLDSHLHSSSVTKVVTLPVTSPVLPVDDISHSQIKISEMHHISSSYISTTSDIYHTQTLSFQDTVSEHLRTSLLTISKELHSSAKTELESSILDSSTPSVLLSSTKPLAVIPTTVSEMLQSSTKYSDNIHTTTLMQESSGSVQTLETSGTTQSSKQLSSVQTSDIDETQKTAVMSVYVTYHTTVNTEASSTVKVQRVTPPYSRNTHVMTTALTSQPPSNNEVLLIFKLGEKFRKALQLFIQKLHSALVKMMNRFYRPKRISRNTDLPHVPLFISEDVHILNATVTGDNLTIAQVAIDQPGNTSDEFISSNILLELLQREDVRQFILDQLMDPDAFLVEAVPVDSRETTSVNRSTTPIPDIKHKDDWDIHTLFFTNLGLFISIIAITTVCIVCIITAILYVRSKGKRGSWKCKTKDYYIKCEKTLLMQKNRRSLGQVDSPLTDKEIMNDEEQMVEKVPLSSEENLTSDAVTQSSNGDTDTDNAFDDKGWIIPVNELLVQNGQRLLLYQEDTRL